METLPPIYGPISGYIVYIVFGENDEVLYVGYTERLIGRIRDKDHILRRKQVVKNCSEIRTLPFKSRREALKWEARIIGRSKAKYNKDFAEENGKESPRLKGNVYFNCPSCGKKRLRWSGDRESFRCRCGYECKDIPLLVTDQTRPDKAS